MIIAHTVKAQGLTARPRTSADCHNIKVPDETTYQRLMCGLECKMDLPY